MSVLILGFAYVSWHIKTEVDAYNLDYYAGKDNGFFAQLDSIIGFGVLFFLLMSKRKRWIYACIGLVLSLITGIVIYLYVMTSLWLPAISGLVLVLLFFAIEYGMEKRHQRTVDQ